MRAAGIDQSHRQRRAQAGPEGAGSDVADRFRALVHNPLTFAHRAFSIDAQPDPPPRNAALQLFADHGRARVAALARAAGPPCTVDGPTQSRLYRRDLCVQLVTVQTQPGLQAQGVARAQARGGDGRFA